MKYDKVLVTGGAGFIGSHTVDALIAKNYSVHVLDNLDPQVHGTERNLPKYFNKQANFTLCDVSNTEVLTDIIEDVDAIIHLAARVGVAQSMYDIKKYVYSNTGATASLLKKSGSLSCWRVNPALLLKSLSIESIFLPNSTTSSPVMLRSYIAFMVSTMALNVSS